MKKDVVKYLIECILRATKTAPHIDSLDGHLIVTRVFDDKVTISSKWRRITIRGTLLKDVIENVKDNNVEVEILKA